VKTFLGNTIALIFINIKFQIKYMALFEVFFKILIFFTEKQESKFPKLTRMNWNFHTSLKSVKRICMWFWDQFWKYLIHLKIFEIF